MERVRKSGGGISRTTSDQTSDGGKILRGENEVVSNLCLCVYMARLATWLYKGLPKLNTH